MLGPKSQNAFPILTQKRKFTAEIGNSQPNNAKKLENKTLKPMIIDAEPNKCVLEAVKSRDPGHAPFRGMLRTT